MSLKNKQKNGESNRYLIMDAKPKYQFYPNSDIFSKSEIEIIFKYREDLITLIEFVTRKFDKQDAV